MMNKIESTASIILDLETGEIIPENEIPIDTTIIDSERYTSDLVRPSENEAINNTINQVDLQYLPNKEKNVGRR